MALTRNKWLLILVIGLVVWGLADVTLRYTKNVLYFPTIMVVGAFLIPSAFIAYFYQRETVFDRGVHQGSILPTLLVCALFGGLVGTLAAGLLESKTLNSSALSSLAWVGIIEEFAKLIFPVGVYIVMRKRFRSELDGLLFGVASGMAFAAIETMGYELVSLVTSQGNINVLDQTILIRGLLSPAGHAAWTGIITATLWRGRERTGKWFTPMVPVFFLIAATLHTLWDLASSANSAAVIVPSYIVIAGVSLGLLIWRYRQARRAALTANHNSLNGAQPKTEPLASG